jgi:fatty acid desaturase
MSIALEKNLQVEVVSIRESMRNLPGFFQPFLTWLSGKPLHGENPWKLTPMDHLMSCFASLLAGVALGIVAAHYSGFWLLLLAPSWLLTIHAVRKLRGVISHQCSHANFLPSQKVNDFIGEAVSVLFMTQNYEVYKREHVSAHHSIKHMTPDDPTVAFLLRMVGARAGMPREVLWKKMVQTMFSPLFHLKFVRNRFISNFVDASVPHRIATLFLWLGLLAIPMLTGTWREFLLAWVLPLTIPLHMVECLRLSGKHVFPARNLGKRGRNELAGFTHGIFFGDPVPDPWLPLHRKAGAWTAWWLRLAFYHLPSRMLVVVGDAPCHDYHHRYPKAKNWSNYMFERYQEELNPRPGWPAYTEVWGLYDAIDACFSSLSAADPRDYPIEETRGVSDSEMLEALEE